MSVCESDATLAQLTYRTQDIVIALLLVVVLGLTNIFWHALVRADAALALEHNRPLDPELISLYSANSDAAGRARPSAIRSYR